MAAKKPYQPGTFCWGELNTADGPAAKAFYSALFGWESRDEPGAPGMPYTKFLVGDAEVAGLAPLPAEMQADVPNHWRSYIAVASADESAAKVTDLGGTVLGGPFDAHEAGRLALAKDTMGAPFVIWEAKNYTGADRFNEPGCLSWNELFSTDPEESMRFYCELFGWTTKVSDTPAGWPYYEWKNGERSAGGMLKIQSDWGPIPPHWNHYFTVSSLAATLDKARELEAKVLMTREIDIGEFATLDDPQGAGFTVIEMSAGKVADQPPLVD